tara:strand:- start:2239 stop:2490 length:252 start_codon:yes stop_codon:yes gene_type:complete
MKVKDIIETLKKNYNPEDSLIVATWDKEQFAPLLEEDDDWADIAQSCMDEVDWSDISQDIIEHIQSNQGSHYGDAIFEGVEED